MRAEERSVGWRKGGWFVVVHMEDDGLSGWLPERGMVVGMVDGCWNGGLGAKEGIMVDEMCRA